MPPVDLVGIDRVEGRGRERPAAGDDTACRQRRDHRTDASEERAEGRHRQPPFRAAYAGLYAPTHVRVPVLKRGPLRRDPTTCNVEASSTNTEYGAPPEPTSVE